MATYQITQPDGSVYEADADNPESAHKIIKDHIQQNLNESVQKKFDDAPMWAKPLIAAHDVGSTALSSATLGGWDKAMGLITGRDEAAMSEAIRNRMGGAQYAADFLGGAVSPTGVGSAVARVGGGPLARAITGGIAATGEGALQGGVQSAIKGEDIVPGTLAGAAGGAAGQGIAGLLAKPANAVSRWWQGAKDALPAPGVANIGSVSNVTGNKAAVARKVEQAARDATNAGGTAKDFRDAFSAINPTFMPKDQRALLSTVSEGDLGTKIPGAIAKGMEKAQTPLGILSAVAGTKSIPAGMALAAGGYAAPAVLRSMEKSGTDASVEALRRATLGLPKFPDFISETVKARLGQGARRSIMEGLH
jgi:hypothetical protein